MSELVRGQVTDRPWGMTLGALGLRGLTGRLALPADGFGIAFRDGAVVHALSKDPRDAAVEVALTLSLVTPAQAAQIIASRKGRDEIELVAEVAKLAPDHVDRLRRTVFAQRTARTFAVERGEFVVDNILPEVTASAVDIRPILYLGAHSYMSEDRLVATLERLGTYFRLKDEAKDDVPRFGFTGPELEVVKILGDGATIGDLVIAHPQIERRSLHAMVYALIAGLAVEFSAKPPARARLRTRGKATVPPEAKRTRSKVNSQVTFKMTTPKRKVPTAPPPEPAPASAPEPESMFDLGAELKSELEAEPPPAPTPAPEPEPAPCVARRTAQMIAFVAVPREPAPPARPETLDDAPLHELAQSPAERARTPTPFGHLIAPRKPAK